MVDVSKLQAFSFKVKFNKLPTRECVFKDKRKLASIRKRSKIPELVDKVYSSEMCLGVVNPSYLHIMECNAVLRIAKKLSRIVLTVVNKHLKNSGKKTVKNFPSFYRIHHSLMLAYDFYNGQKASTAIP